ncbi:hypothetical protein PIB30_105744, partial [Stylosanthes scabra]|nr:hypothetical protein [Stylosanthes scabra]
GRRLRGDGRGQGRGDTGARVDGEGGRSEPGPAGQHDYVDGTLPDFGSPSASFFDGILSPASLEQRFGQEGAYYADLARCLQIYPQTITRPATDQVQAPLPMDLNELPSDILGDFSFTLGGTPPSAFKGVPPQLDHDIPAEEGHEEPVPEPRRGRRVPRRRGCGTGGHM